MSTLPFPASHSQITTYQDCPLKFHYKYRTRTKGEQEGTPTLAMQRGIDVHKQIERFLKGQGTLPFMDKEAGAMFEHWLAKCYPSMPNEGVQSEIRLDALYHGYPIMGYLDALWVDDAGNPPHTAYICDVKTGDNLYFLGKKLWFSLQPDLYAILVRANANIEEVVWVQHNVTAKGAEVQYRKVELTAAREKVLLYWLKEMELDNAAPNESWKCGQCQFEAICGGRLMMGQDLKFEYSTYCEEGLIANETE